MQTFKQRNQRVIVSVVMTIMMVLAMVPAMAFAAEGYTGSVVIMTRPAAALSPGTVTQMQARYSISPQADCHIDWSLEGCDSSVATISRHNGKLTAVGGGTGIVKATLRLGKAQAGTGDQSPCTGEVVATAKVSFSVASTESYGFQGIGGNTIKLVSPSEQGISAIRTPQNDPQNSSYFNVVSNETAIESDSTGNYYKFGYKLSAGFNNFQESTFNGYASEINVHRVIGANEDQAGDVVAPVVFDSFTNGTAYIKFAKEKLPAGTYILRFGPNVCGNNSAKKLGTTVDFKFTIQ